MRIASNPRLPSVRQSLGLCLALTVSIVPIGLAAQAKKAAPAPAKAASAAGPRTIALAAGDDMKYDKTTIEAKPGEEIRIRLTPKGTMPKVAMSHNVVVLKLGTDAAAFANAGMAARATEYIAPDKKSQVIAATPLAGNGETVETTFKVPAAAGSYPFLCTFPGHFAAGMKGTLVVKK